jgi:aspartate aminotransferase
MFAFTGMSSDMCDALTEEHAIFLTRDGRISLAGLNDGNIEYVARAIHAVTDGKSITSSSS